MNICLDNDVVKLSVERLTEELSSGLFFWINQNNKVRSVLPKQKQKQINGLIDLLKRPKNKPSGVRMDTLVEHWLIVSFSEDIQNIQAELLQVEKMAAEKSLSATEQRELKDKLEKAISGLDNVEQVNLQQMSCFLDVSVFGKI